jgi:hypothetical protein
MLATYADALGLPPFDPEFFSGPSALAVHRATPPPGALVLAMSEARERLGFASEMCAVTGEKAQGLRSGRHRPQGDETSHCGAPFAWAPSIGRRRQAHGDTLNAARKGRALSDLT